MEKLRSEKFNQILIVVEYSRASTDFYNHLEILERCLNGVVDRSVMLIINKTPNKAKLKKSRIENPTFNLDTNIKQLRDEIARVFRFIFSADFSLVEELDDEDDEKANDAELEEIRNVIGFSEEFEFSNAKTWSELLKIYEEAKNNKENEIKLKSQIIADLEDKIKKDAENISYLQSQLDIIKQKEEFVSEIQGVAGKTIKTLLKPAVYFSKKMLKKPAEERIAQINKLEENKKKLQERLDSSKTDNAKLIEEKNIYLNEINRLQKLLREN